MSTKVEQANDIAVTIGIIENRLLSFSLTDYAIKNKIPVEFDKYDFTLELNFQLIAEKKQLSVNFNSKLFQKQEQNLRVELASLSSLTLYVIINFDELMKFDAETNRYLIPNQLLHLCSASIIGSARGMYSVCLKDTLYSNCVFPLMDVTTFIPKELQS